MNWRRTAGATALTALVALYFAPLGDFLAERPLPGQSIIRDNLIFSCLLFIITTVLLGLFAQQRSAAPKIPEGRAWRNDERPLRELRARMRRIWIDGALADSLESLVPLQLRFTSKVDLLTSPLVLVNPSKRDQVFEKSASLADVYSHSTTQGRLLVLGGPGSGKTNQLFHLAEALLDAADATPDAPVPVLIPLSAGKWQDDPRDSAHHATGLKSRVHDRMDAAILNVLTWMANEIATRYQISRRHAHELLHGDQSPLVVLFDGIDEIKDADARQRCVRMLNQLAQQCSFGLVVTCRTSEYRALRVKLAFDAKVEINRVTPKRIDAYLAAGGEELESLRLAVQSSPSLQEFLQTPLALGIAMLTFRKSVPGDKFKHGTDHERLSQLWDQYLDDVLSRLRDKTSRDTGDPRFKPEKVRSWLAYLAGVMHEAGQTEFRPDLVTVESLPRGHNRALRWALGGVWIGLTIAVFSGLMRSVAPLGTGVAIVSTIAAGMAGLFHLNWIYSSGRQGKLSIEWELSFLRVLAGAFYGAITGLFFGIFIGIWSGPAGLLAGLIPGVIVGLVAGVATMAVPVPSVDLSSGSQRSASTQTIRVQLAVVATAALIPFGIYAFALNFISSTVFAEKAITMSIAPAVGIAWATATSNLYPWISHRVARLWVVAARLLPLRLAAFLAHAEERIIMRSSGRGYQFLHVTLQEHLATQAGRGGRTHQPTRGKVPVPVPQTARPL